MIPMMRVRVQFSETIAHDVFFGIRTETEALVKAEPLCEHLTHTLARRNSAAVGVWHCVGSHTSGHHHLCICVLWAVFVCGHDRAALMAAVSVAKGVLRDGPLLVTHVGGVGVGVGVCMELNEVTITIHILQFRPEIFLDLP